MLPIQWMAVGNNDSYEKRYLGWFDRDLNIPKYNLVLHMKKNRETKDWDCELLFKNIFTYSGRFIETNFFNEFEKFVSINKKVQHYLITQVFQ